MQGIGFHSTPLGIANDSMCRSCKWLCMSAMQINAGKTLALTWCATGPADGHVACNSAAEVSTASPKQIYLTQ
jgi:hypothetical protein